MYNFGKGKGNIRREKAKGVEKFHCDVTPPKVLKTNVLENQMLHN